MTRTLLTIAATIGAAAYIGSRIDRAATIIVSEAQRLSGPVTFQYQGSSYLVGRDQ